MMVSVGLLLFVQFVHVYICVHMCNILLETNGLGPGPWKHFPDLSGPGPSHDLGRLSCFDLQVSRQEIQKKTLPRPVPRDDFGTFNRD